MARLDQLEDLIASTVTIPTIPATLMEIDRIVRDPDGSAAEAARVVAQDPAIASKVLRLANSSIYALQVAVSDIQHAVCILGLQVLENVVIQATVLEQFRRPESGQTTLCATWLWDHSLKSACAARSIVRCSPVDFGVDPEEAYTSGLLHDVGKVLLLDSCPKEYEAASRLSQEERIALFEAEERVLGYSHAAVGALLAERWNMSPVLCGAVERHHAGDMEPNEAAHLLQIADGIAHQVRAGPSGYFCGTTLSEETLERLELTPEVFEAILTEVTDASVGELG